MAPQSSPDSLDLPAAKAVLRGRLLARRSQLDEAARASASQALAAAAGAIAAIVGHGPLSAFWPIGEEIDPRPLMAALAARSIRLALPVVTREGLIFRGWQPGEALEKAGFGLSQPPAEAATVVPAAMLVPLLGFDRRGGRLGYGRGYYDGAIARYRPQATIGLAFACQEVDAVPMDAHDRRLDRVLTERGMIDCRAGSGH